MKLLRIVGIISAGCAIASCGESGAVRDTANLAPCTFSKANELPVHGKARGVGLDLPADAKGPFYDSDDWYLSRPTWTGTRWHVHFVYDNGGLTEYMKGSRCCSLNDNEMHRNVCLGKYIYYGAMADISRVASPEKVSSAQVTIEPNGITENQALSIIASMVTTWEQQ